MNAAEDKLSKINVTGMQGNRAVVQAALPQGHSLREAIFWSLDEIRSVLVYLDTGRSTQAKRAAAALLAALAAGTSEQPGPPVKAERERRDTDWVKAAQERYAEGYRCRAATPAPDAVSRYTKKGRPIMRAQPFASMAESAEGLCPKRFPAHERERWLAGFLDADRLAVERGHGSLEGRDPLKVPRKPRPPAVAVPLDAFGDEGRMTRREAVEFWRRHRDSPAEYIYRDAGEQE